jgi:hypothetical protein
MRWIIGTNCTGESGQSWSICEANGEQARRLHRENHSLPKFDSFPSQGIIKGIMRSKITIGRMIINPQIRG